MSESKKNPVSGNRIFILILLMVATYIISFFVLTRNITDRKPKHVSVTYKIEGVSYNLPVYSADSIIVKLQPGAAPGDIAIGGGLFNRNPVFLVWAQLILIMLSIAAGACALFCWQAAWLKSEYSLEPAQIVRMVVYAMLLCVILGVISGANDLLYRPDKVICDFGILFADAPVPKFVVISTLVLVIPIIATIFILVPASDTISIDPKTRDEFEENAGKLERLHKVLVSALQTLAVIVVFSVLTSGALRETIKATIHIPYFDLFPKQESYVYGLFFSSFLGIIYVPVHLLLKQRSEQLRDGLDKLKKAGQDEKWLKEMDALVSTKNTALDNMKLMFTVLSPLITSFLPELMKMK